ncbi:MAG: hypothetical protein Ct9H90mP16_01710 [Candidatus Poseidoniales archaeon]|nr:MAG: hypothetical protein Ct9H90mP16_01710 [Candidatus Poseidoniales archaeon]
MTERMSIREILEEHPKGVDYAHLLEGFTEFPVIVEPGDRVPFSLSPPSSMATPPQ